MTTGAQAYPQPTPPVMKTPRTVDVEITSRCNLRCRYCYYYDNPTVPYRDLATAEWISFFEECGRCRIMDITLQGGEPFIRIDLKRLLEGIVKNRMRFSLLSNGTRINADIAEFIARTGRCNSVQVSVDGSGPETHDACRGEGSFKKAIRGIEILREHDIPVDVRVTVHRRNVHDLEETAQLLLADLGLPGFTTNAAGYLGTCRLRAGEVLLNTAERQEAMESLLRLAETYPGRISAQAGPLAEGRAWRRMEEACTKKVPPFANGGYLTACGCHNSKLGVRADGAYVACCMLPHMTLGRINRDALMDVWQNSPDLNRLRHRYRIPLTNFAFCRGCPYLPYCTGNCPALAYALTGKVDHPSPDACLRRFLADGGRVTDESAMAIEQKAACG